MGRIVTGHPYDSRNEDSRGDSPFRTGWLATHTNPRKSSSVRTLVQAGPRRANWPKILSILVGAVTSLVVAFGLLAVQELEGLIQFGPIALVPPAVLALAVHRPRTAVIFEHHYPRAEHTSVKTTLHQLSVEIQRGGFATEHIDSPIRWPGGPQMTGAS